MSDFKPQLAPNTLLSIEGANQLNPQKHFVQVKIDGIRGTVVDGVIKTRSMKELPNKAIKERFKGLIQASVEADVYLDGEFYSESTTFNDLSGILRSFDKPLPDDLVFKVFDLYDPNDPKMNAYERHSWLPTFCKDVADVEVVGNLPWPQDFKELFAEVLKGGDEGLMVKMLDAPYKLGRGTFKQGIIYKMKPYETFDCKVTGFEQATVVREGAEKKINELGRSETSRKKADRVPVESIGAIWVDYFGEPLKVSVASLTHPERAVLWSERESYLGKFLELKGMLVGAKNLPRHPMFVRWRLDK